MPAPEFKTRDEWRLFVEAELASALPAGWKIESTHSIAGAAGSWEIVPITEQGGGADWWFGLEAPADWSHFIVFCGNSDAGPGGVHFFAPHARVIPRAGLALHPLHKILRWVFENHEPNVRGLS